MVGERGRRWLGYAFGLVGMFGSPALDAVRAEPPARRPVDDIVVCPFTPAELSAALGLDLKPGVPRTSDFGTGLDLRCDYPGQRLGDPMLRVYQLGMKNASPTRMVRKFKAGTMEEIAGDPDGAMWQVGQGDLEAVALVYNRDHVDVTVRFEPGRTVLADPAQVRAARERVLRLVRLPRYR